jgi:RNA polymerase sigma-70 factor (ECF subfamily)
MISLVIDAACSSLLYILKVVAMQGDPTPLAARTNIGGYALTGNFEYYAPALYRYIFRLCNNAVMADQIMMEARVKLNEHLSTGKVPKSHLHLFLYKAVYHLIVNNGLFHYRLGRMEAVDLGNGDRQSTSMSAENRVLFDAILLAITNDLTEDQRHVLLLRFVEGFSVKETATIIGKTVANVKVIQNRAMATLRKALDFQEDATNTISIMIRSLSDA